MNIEPNFLSNYFYKIVKRISLVCKLFIDLINQVTHWDTIALFSWSKEK